jgi:enoyl-CoA hydratase/carnithine racemase
VTMGAFEDLIVEQDGAVTVITVNRPARLNSLRIPQTVSELTRALDEIDDDRDTRVVVITGAGDRAFSTGFDLAEPGAWADDDRGWYEMANADFKMLMRIWELRQPVIAAVNGLAVASGANLAMVCDLTIAAENASFAEPEIRHLALSPLLLLPWLTGSKVAHELYYTGDEITAQRALELGLVNKVVPPGEALSEAVRVARRISLVPSLALEMTKRTIKKTYEIMGIRDALDWHRMADTFMLASDTPEKQLLLDAYEAGGMRAFLEARDGPFRDQE